MKNPIDRLYDSEGKLEREIFREWHKGYELTYWYVPQVEAWYGYITMADGEYLWIESPKYYPSREGILEEFREYVKNL